MWDTDERDQFYRQLLLLAEAMGETISAVRLAAYAGALDDLPARQVGFAIHDAIRTCRFFPKPVEIRELASASLAWLDDRRAEFERLHGRAALLGPEPISEADTQENFARLADAIRRLGHTRRMD
jgi:hypothetical protein